MEQRRQRRWRQQTDRPFFLNQHNRHNRHNRLNQNNLLTNLFVHTSINSRLNKLILFFNHRGVSRGGSTLHCRPVVESPRTLR